MLDGNKRNRLSASSLCCELQSAMQPAKKPSRQERIGSRCVDSARVMRQLRAMKRKRDKVTYRYSVHF